MKKGEEIRDRTRNNRFAEAFDYLRRNTDVKNRKQLAEMMGVSKDTITRIMHAYTPLTEDAISKFQAATGCIFNLQWLRGESDTMFVTEKERCSAPVVENPHQSASMPIPDYGSLMNATIAAQDATIASLKRELADKDESTRREMALVEESAKRELAAKEETISALREQLSTKDALVESLKQQVADLRSALAKLQAKEITGHYPYPMGLAEETQQLSK